MSEHYNIQVSIQKVIETPVSEKARGLSSAITGTQKRVLDVAKIAVQADTESEAYAQVQRILSATQTPTNNGIGIGD